jgi:hypothetical protein
LFRAGGQISNFFFASEFHDREPLIAAQEPNQNITATMSAVCGVQQRPALQGLGAAKAMQPRSARRATVKAAAVSTQHKVRRWRPMPI